MSNKVCKFYAQGACSYGSSCRFLHSDNIVSNYQYNNKYQPRYSKFKFKIKIHIGYIGNRTYEIIILFINI